MKQVENAQVMQNEALSLAVRSFMEAGGSSPILSDSYLICPGFCDVHVHFREPGYFYKETVHTGCDAAIGGGYTAVCTMPNLNPVPDCVESLNLQLNAIKEDGRIAVLPYGAITVGELGKELADLDAMAKDVVAFSDDGRGVQSREMMRDAMLRAKALGKIIVAHCEDNSLLKGGYIHDGVYAREHGHKGICSESEYLPIARDLELVRETGCAYHVCHVSAKESVELIRKAKAEGLNVTCETAPHYLVLCDEDLKEDGRFKMNPPIRGKEDRDALIAGILDGTIDMIATDHAPHSAEEKGRGLEKSLMGVVGLETAFPILYTRLVEPGILSLEKLVDLLCINPRARFGITHEPGYTVFEVGTSTTVDPEEFHTKGRSTPFAGDTVRARWLMTCIGDNCYVR